MVGCDGLIIIMWIINKTKETFIRDGQLHKLTQEFKMVEELVGTQGNVLPIAKLEMLSSYTFDLERCEIIFQILDNKLKRYTKKSKVDKLFKILVVIDYVLLNGASAMIDLFKDSLPAIQRLSTGAEWGHQEWTAKQEQFKEMVTIKSVHLVLILSNKEKRLEEKLRLNQAKLLLRGDRLEENNSDHSPTIAPEVISQGMQPSSSFLKKRPHVFVKFQKFMEKKLVKLSSALLGLIDPDYEISDDYLRNKEFMQRGQSIIQQVEDRERQKIEKEKEEETSKKLDAEVQKMEEKVRKNQNLLELVYEFV